jgi:DNA-binding NarL/FixJ family response regulator
MRGDDCSVARLVQIPDATGSRRSVCCVLTSLSDPAVRCFILVVPPTGDPPESGDRVRELEQHLLRIAAEVNASRVLEQVGTVPDPQHLLQLGDLSTRQWEVLTRLMRGQRVPTIAKEMFLSQNTIRNHLSAIYARFGVHSQVELLARLNQS